MSLAYILNTPDDQRQMLAAIGAGSVEELFAALRQHDPGKVVAISYVRDGEASTAQAQITDRPS